MKTTLTRRSFLRQTIAFSALATSNVLAHGAPDLRNPDAKHAIIVGDWGWADPAQGQSQVAAAMRRYTLEQKLNSEALLLLGDSWYGDLSGGADSPRWQSGFEAMYPEDAFPNRAYTIAGNHDYQHAPISKVEAELEYAKRKMTAAGRPMRWTMPSLWYRFVLPEKNPLLTVIALDSNVPGHRSFGAGFYTMTEAMRQQQLTWLEEELKKPRDTPFLAVMAHHPMYSNGKHGDHPILIQDWDHLLREHQVHLYLAGHDHDLQHLEFEGHPTSFFCSGAGGADLYDLHHSKQNRGPFAEKVFGFSHLEMTSELLTLRHLDENGTVLHAFSKQQDGKVTLLDKPFSPKGA